MGLVSTLPFIIGLLKAFPTLLLKTLMSLFNQITLELFRRNSLVFLLSKPPPPKLIIALTFFLKYSLTFKKITFSSINRKYSSPNFLKISLIFKFSSNSIIESISKKLIPNFLANTLPQLVLPEPIIPTKVINLILLFVMLFIYCNYNVYKCLKFIYFIKTVNKDK